MKRGGGKQKGNRFERDICRDLTEWVAGAPKPEIFWRSAASGGKATQDARKGLKSRMGGDISSVDDAGAWLTALFSFELKHYKDFRFDQIFTHPSLGLIGEWWDQAVRDARASGTGKRPILIFRKNLSPVYLAHRPDLRWSLAFPTQPRPRAHFVTDVRKFTVVLFKDWMAHYKAEDVREAYADLLPNLLAQ